MTSEIFERFPAYRLAALDEEFILGDSMRGARFMMEYAKAEEHLRRHRIRSTVVAFGSARVREDGNEWQARIYTAARRFGQIVSERGGALNLDGKWRDNVIATGGGPGVMEAANRGAQDAGAVTIGFNIALPHEQFPNPYITPDLCFQFHYFAMRKMHLAMRAQGLAIFPGGFGTLDEFFETLTLIQTGRMQRVPLLLFGKAFWDKDINLDALADAGTIAPDDVNLFTVVDSAEEGWEVIREHYNLPEVKLAG